MTDNSRSVVWEASSLPFGEDDSLTGSAANDNRFPGQRVESETGLHYNYFRDYDPTTGRYLQSDPIGLEGGINTYGYVGGNPVNYVDPTGEHPIIVVAGGVIKVGKEAVKYCIKHPKNPQCKKAVEVIEQCKVWIKGIFKKRGNKPKEGSQGGPGAGKNFSEK